MVEDWPDEGYFMSALKAFVTRTCYANAAGVFVVAAAAVHIIIEKPLLLKTCAVRLWKLTCEWLRCEFEFTWHLL